jgi:hypothetical protein
VIRTHLSLNSKTKMLAKHIVSDLVFVFKKFH